MSEGGLESFVGQESTEGVDHAALERLRERMQQAQQQAQRDQKREQKQKKTEQNLAQVLATFLQKRQSGLIKVVTQAIAGNIPAQFVICVLALRFNSIRTEVGFSPPSEPTSQQTALLPANLTNTEMSPFQTMEMDFWLKFLIEQATTQPQKLLNSLKHDIAMHALINLAGYVMQDYLQKNSIQFNGSNVINFAQTFTHSLRDYLSDYISKQTQIKHAE